MWNSGIWFNYIESWESGDLPVPASISINISNILSMILGTIFISKIYFFFFVKWFVDIVFSKSSACIVLLFNNNKIYYLYVNCI